MPIPPTPFFLSFYRFITRFYVSVYTISPRPLSNCDSARTAISVAVQIYCIDSPITMKGSVLLLPGNNFPFLGRTFRYLCRVQGEEEWGEKKKRREAAEIGLGKLNPTSLAKRDHVITYRCYIRFQISFRFLSKRFFLFPSIVFALLLRCVMLTAKPARTFCPVGKLCAVRASSNLPSHLSSRCSVSPAMLFFSFFSFFLFFCDTCIEEISG